LYHLAALGLVKHEDLLNVSLKIPFSIVGQRQTTRLTMGTEQGDLRERIEEI
jgi:hypothetical protein